MKTDADLPNYGGNCRSCSVVLKHAFTNYNYTKGHKLFVLPVDS